MQTTGPLEVCSPLLAARRTLLAKAGVATQLLHLCSGRAASQLMSSDADQCEPASSHPRTHLSTSPKDQPPSLSLVLSFPGMTVATGFLQKGEI